MIIQFTYIHLFSKKDHLLNENISINKKKERRRNRKRNSIGEERPNEYCLDFHPEVPWFSFYLQH